MEEDAPLASGVSDGRGAIVESIACGSLKMIRERRPATNDCSLLFCVVLNPARFRSALHDSALSRSGADVSLLLYFRTCVLFTLEQPKKSISCAPRLPNTSVHQYPSLGMGWNERLSARCLACVRICVATLEPEKAVLPQASYGWKTSYPRQQACRREIAETYQPQGDTDE